MIITFWKGVFVADTLDEPGALRKAGFELHEPTMCQLKEGPCRACKAGIGRRWWSNQIEAATRLRKHCNGRALNVMKQHLQMLARSRATDADVDVPSPEGFEYKPYQRAGIAYALQRKDTLIADEPGLGKTIQALGFMNVVKPQSAIVVCPATLVFNWAAEAELWLTCGLEVVEVMSRRVEVPDREGLLVIVNYEKLIGDSALTTSIARRTWDVAVFDEAHYLKNPESKRSQACIGQEGIMRRAHRCLFLTGTPIENYPKEIWPIASAINPGKFGDWWAFAKRYCGAHKEERHGRKVWVTEGASHLGELQQRMRASFMVRRLKRDVLPELPPKRRQLIVLPDSRVDWSKDPLMQKWRETYERQYDDAFARLEAARTDTEYREAAMALEKVTGVAFEEMSELRHALGVAKLPACLSYIDELRHSGVESMVVFAHHRDVIDGITDHLGGDAVTVHGQTPYEGPRSRKEAVRAFQAREKRFFVGQIKAAGTGLTLTAADTVIFVESDWVPGAITQCEDRLCRIGQKKMVHVIHPVLRGTIEVNMLHKILLKQDVIDKALDRTTDVNLKLRRAG